MRQMERQGNPSGRRSSAISSKNAPISRPSKRCMSWWTLGISKHMKHLKMDCHIGRQQWRGGTAVFNWWDPTKRERSCSFFRPLKRLACIGCIPPGQVHLSWLRWWLYFRVSTLSCWTVTACLSPFSRQQTYGRKGSLPGFHRDPERVSHSSIHCTEGVIL